MGRNTNPLMAYSYSDAFPFRWLLGCKTQGHVRCPGRRIDPPLPARVQDALLEIAGPRKFVRARPLG